MGHLTEPELTGYQKRTLQADSLLRVTGHLAECEQCRSSLRHLAGIGASMQDLRQWLEIHLTAEQLQQFIDGELDSGARTRVERHIDTCVECASDVEALREFANSPAVSRSKARYAWRWWLAAAAALVIAFGVRIWLRRPAVIAALNDAGGRITLNSHGQVEGVAGLSSQEMESVRHTLQGNTLAVHVNLSELEPPAGSLMGSSAPAVFHLVTPVGTAVRSTRPELHWSPRGPAATYVVTLKNIASGQVTSSPPLSSLTWTPNEPLLPGALYAWQVAASVDGHEELAPSPPSPEARFLVLDAATVTRLDNLPQSHLVRATLYADAGLLDDAQREAEALEEENPASNVASELLKHIHSLRRIEP